MTLISLTCPSCHESGKVPEHFAGVKIKCKKCGNSFVVPGQATAPKGHPAAPKAAATATAKATVPADGIPVDGLDESAWSTTTEVIVEAAPLAVPAHDPAASALFTAVHLGEHHGVREYKVFTSRDKSFQGKFTLELLEVELNRLARIGWVVKGMSTPHLEGFSGGPKELLVVLLEREVVHDH